MNVINNTGRLAIILLISFLSVDQIYITVIPLRALSGQSTEL